MVTAFGLVALLLINLGPILLVLRQAASPESESSRWPLRWLPQRMSPENVVSLWQTQSLSEHVLLSLWVAVGTTIVSLALGFPAGWAAARSHDVEGMTTTTALLSRVLPPIAVAIPLTALLIPLRLYNHPLGLGLIAGHVTLGLPFAILLAYAAFRNLPPELEEAAIVDGCSTFAAFFRVALPAARGALGASFILVFLLSWDEFAYALLIQLTHRTMPPLIYYYTEFGQIGAASVLAVLMLLPAILVIATLQRTMTRGIISGVLKA